MPEDTISVLDGSTFLVSDRRGDARGETGARRTDGLFFRDMRHLSTFELNVEGASLRLLSTNNTHYYAAAFYVSVDTGSVYQAPEISITRRRNLLQTLREELTLQNHSQQEIPVRLQLRFAADFADLFEVKANRIEKRGTLKRSCKERFISFSYARDGFERGTTVEMEVPDSASLDLQPERDHYGPVKATIALTLPPKSGSSFALDIVPSDGGETKPTHNQGFSESRGKLLQEEFRDWMAQSPRLSSDHDTLEHSWRATLADLAALRIGRAEVGDSEEVLAAGLPWFMTLFGRDSLVGSFQTLPMKPELAKASLRALAKRQASKVVDFQDSRPGKIPHELRFGELTHFGEQPQRPYYGTVDATPQFLILLHEAWRWTADEGLLRELEGPARRALGWISNYGDSNGDGYTDYIKRSPEGLDNQGWKDSSNSILFANGSRAEPPIALCEVQGYVYDAWLRTAEIASRLWDDEKLAGELREKAGELRERFTRDFWIEDRGCYALALDKGGRKVDSLTSNMGQLLWSGIVPEERVGVIVRHLFDPDTLFSGWGVRTMAKADRGYNPIEYHNGTGWPHDNSLITYGLFRCGYREEANRIVSALLEATACFGYTLPEVFAGYDRSETHFPVEYPTASRPQAWASGTIPLLVRAVLGLEPDPESRKLTVDPVLPEGMTSLRLTSIPAFGKSFDLEAEGGEARVSESS